MAAALGGLVVSLTADTVSFQDSLTKAAYTMSQTMGQMASSVDSIASRFGMLQHAAEALVFSAAIRGMSDFVSGAVAAEARLQDLGVMAGATAAQMSALIPAATLSGTNIEDVSLAAEHLERSLSPMSINAKAAQSALATLGFSAEDAKRFLADPTEGLYELSQRLNTFADDGNKTAVIMALMGRSAGEMLPFLKQLGEQSQLTATLTNEQTRAAHDLVTEWNALTLRGEELRNEVASGLVPALSAMLGILTDAGGPAGGLGAEIKTLASDGSFARWAVEIAIGAATIGEAFTAIGKSLYALVGSFEVVVEDIKVAWSGLEFFFGASGDELNKAIAEKDKVLADADQRWSEAWNSNKTELSDALKAELDELNRYGPQFQAAMQAMYELPDNADARDIALRGLAAEKAAPPGHLGSDQVLKASAEFTSEMDALTAAAAKANIEMAKLLDPTPMTAAEQAFAQFVASDKWDKLTVAEKNATAVKEMLVEATERHLSLLQAEAADQALAVQQSIAAAVAFGDEATASGAIGAAQDAANTSIGTMLQSMQLQAQTAGMDSQATQELAFEMAMLHAGIEKGSDLWNNYLAAYEKWANDAARGKAAVQAAHDAEQAWKQASGSIENNLDNAFDGWAHGAKNLGQQLRDDLLKMFDTLYLRPILQPIAGSIAGLAFPGVASASGGAGGVLSGASDLVSLFGGSGGIAGIADTAYGALGLGSNLFTSGLADLSIAAQGGAAAVGGFGPLLSGALPVIGPIAAIAALFAGGLFSSGGGPKSGGFGESGSGFDRFYTPSQDDSSLLTLANTTLTSYNTLLSNLGGTGSANFAFGYDTDPKGTSPTRLSAGATVNGKSVFDLVNQNEGSGTTNLKADLQLEAERALLTALQSSNLPKDIANILDSVTPSSASLDQIKQIEEIASAYGDLSKDLAANPLADALDAVRKQSEGAYGAFEDQITAYKSLLSTYDGSTTATTALDKASQGLYASLVSVLAQVQEVKASLDTMFGDTVRKFRIDSLDKQGQYGFYQTEVSSLMKQISTASDPDAVKQLETLVNQDLQAAFGLLDPTQRSALLNQYIAAANAADAAGNLRLTSLGASATNQFSDAAKQAQQALTDAANKMHDAASTIAAAATTQTTAANTALRAAQTPVTLNVNVNGTTAAEVNIG